MLVRKHDWHDHDGVQWLLEHGADPNRASRWGQTAFHQALRRDNALPIIELLLDHGADPRVEWKGESAVALAARAGRGDVLDLLARRGFATDLAGVLGLIAACATNDAALVRRVAEREPGLVAELRAEGGERLAEFAGVGNTEGVRLLLDLGVPVDARFEEGDGYFDVAKDSTALHVAAWRAWPATLKLLLERGAAVAATDARARTALALAVRACVDSYWTERRSPESVAALLAAGASVSGVAFPSGYTEVDELLRSRGCSDPA
jgi:ankyrin repeat protein